MSRSSLFSVMVVISIIYGCVVAFVTNSMAFIIGGAVVVAAGWVLVAGSHAPRQRDRSLRRAGRH